MMGIVVPETCSAYKKYNKIISGISLVFIVQLIQYLFVTIQASLATNIIVYPIISP